MKNSIGAIKLEMGKCSDFQEGKEVRACQFHTENMVSLSGMVPEQIHKGTLVNTSDRKQHRFGASTGSPRTSHIKFISFSSL